MQECPNTALSDASDALALGQRLDRTVVLVGMMGSGKTSIGRRLAKAM
ncbi:MAG: hypothetical protein HC871_08205, partial [Rhizobiales bacterium]|nr:hypothetical protein [Hyphomicrobiales bacterium]